MKTVKITSGGQISIPAAIRKRWNAKTVSVDDRGDHILVRPDSEDPIEAARGSLAKYIDIDTEKMRQIIREEEIEAMERRGH